MMQTMYYYLVASFPELAFEQTKMPFSVQQFREHLQMNMAPGDYQLITFLTIKADNENLLNILEKNDKPFNSLGNLSQAYIEEAVKTKEKDPSRVLPSSLEAYIHKFIIHYKNNIPVYPELSWKNQLHRMYFDFLMANIRNPFLRKWLTFERNVKNVQAAFNVRKHNYNMEEEVVGEDDIARALTSAKAKDFGLSQDYDFVNNLLNAYENNNLYEREQQIDRLKWQKLEELTTFHYFSVEVVLAYFLKLTILSRWIQLDEEQGRRVFESIIDKLQSSYEFPKEFVLNGSNR